MAAVEPLRVVSYGGGVQSTALLVLAAQRKLNYPTFLMANVGDDSEHPATLRYVHQFAAPYAQRHGIDLHLIDRRRRDGSIETLYGRLTRAGSRSLPIPVRMSNGAPGTRSCTADFKIRVTGKWLKQHGARPPKPCPAHTPAQGTGSTTSAKPTRPTPIAPDPNCQTCDPGSVAEVAIGISVDEIHRANNRRCEPHERVVYPLLDLRLRRDDCMRIIRDAGLPVPPKSSCWFCPFHRPTVWQDMARREPDLFERACHLEDLLNARRRQLGRDPVYLTRFGKPLREAIDTTQLTLLDLVDDHCDSGWCMT